MNILNISVTVLSTIASVIAITSVILSVRNRERLSWRSVEDGIRSTIKAMNLKSYSPDVIIGIGRGGSIVGAMLAGNLGHVPFFALDTILSRSNGVTIAKARYEVLPPNVTELKIMLTIGDLYSGADLLAAIEMLERKGAKQLTTMALFSHAVTSIRPDYVGRELSKPLNAPWRLTDSYKTRY